MLTLTDAPRQDWLKHLVGVDETKLSPPPRPSGSSEAQRNPAAQTFVTIVITVVRMILEILWAAIVLTAKIIVFVAPRASKMFAVAVSRGRQEWATRRAAEAEVVTPRVVTPDAPSPDVVTLQVVTPEVVSCSRCEIVSVTTLLSPTGTSINLCSQHNATMGVWMQKSGWVTRVDINEYF